MLHVIIHHILSIPLFHLPLFVIHPFPFLFLYSHPFIPPSSSFRVYLHLSIIPLSFWMLPLNIPPSLHVPVLTLNFLLSLHSSLHSCLSFHPWIYTFPPVVIPSSSISPSSRLNLHFHPSIISLSFFMLPLDIHLSTPHHSLPLSFHTSFLLSSSFFLLPSFHLSIFLSKPLLRHLFLFFHAASEHPYIFTPVCPLSPVSFHPSIFPPRLRTKLTS